MLLLEDCSDITDVAAYASVIASSVSESVESAMLTSHGLTFRDFETGAFYFQTQLLQVDYTHTHNRLTAFCPGLPR